MRKKQELVIGSANFRRGYGIKKSVGLNLKQLNNIYNTLKKNNINFIDTAFSYPGVQKKIKLSNLKKLKIYNKIIFKKKIKKKDILTWTNKKILDSLEMTNQNFFEVIYFHKPDQLFSIHGKLFYKALVAMKKKKLIKKIGISVYSPKQLITILKKYKFDVVQIPVNIFDRRFLKKKYLSNLKKNKIEIHARSIFLQGILLKDFKKLPKYFVNWRKLFLTWEKWNKINNKKKIETCINFVKNIKLIDQLIIGISSNKQLREIIKIYRKIDKIQYPVNISSNSQNLIDPRKWPSR